MSAPDVTPPVERLHRVLIDEIAKRQPDYMDRPFTVADIYQSLVPYRSHRDAIGVQMNGDYEDALLRLLAGAGDFVVLESDAALGEIRKELESRNPNTGLFREFPDAPVRLNRTTQPSEPAPPTAFESSVSRPASLSAPELSSSEPASDPETTRPAETSQADSNEAGAEGKAAFPGPESGAIGGSTTFAGPPVEAPSSPATSLGPGMPGPMVPSHSEPASPQPTSGFSILPASEPEPPPTPDFSTRIASSFVEAEITPVAGPDPDAVRAEPSPARDAEGASCSWCSDALPARDNVNFCPHCGRSTESKPCSGCGQEMELGWRYCATCGRESTTGFA